MQRGSALTLAVMGLGLAALASGAFAQQPPAGRGVAPQPRRLDGGGAQSRPRVRRSCSRKSGSSLRTRARSTTKPGEPLKTR